MGKIAVKIKCILCEKSSDDLIRIEAKIKADLKAVAELSSIENEKLLLAEKLQKNHSQLENLTAEKAKLEKEIEEFERNKTKLKQDVKHYEEKAILERKISELADERKNLKAGQPCPLCGAIEHPWAEQVPDDDNETVNILKARKEELETIAEQALKTSNLFTQTVTEIKHKNTEIKRLNTEITEKQKQFQKLAETLEIAVKFEEIESLKKELIEKQNSLKNQILALNELTESENNIKSEIDNLDKIIQEEKDILLDKQSELEKLELKKQNLIGVIYKNQARLSEDIDQIRAKLQKFIDQEITSQSIDHIFEELEERCKLYQNQKSKLQDCEALVKELELKIEHLTKEIKDLSESGKAFGNELNKLLEIKENKAQNRFEIFEDKQIETEREKLNKEKLDLEEKNQSSLELKNNSEKEFLLQQERRFSLEKSFKEVVDSLTKLKTDFENLLLKYSLASEDEYLKLVISDEEKKDIQTRQEACESSLKQTEGQLKEVSENLTQLKEEKLTEDNIEQICEKLELLKESISKLNQESGAIQKELEADEQNRERFKKVADEVVQQQKECEKWTYLKKMIGSREGDSFRRFAQGLTLDFLISLANQKLSLLNHRYVLVRESSSSMNFEVIDTLQADVRRPVESLSGGESFLVSLSLALGLSDLASKSIKIDSLFLDEGFGTLDADTLDIALSALSTLQAQGKTIGIISHVEALKERIPVQIQVKKLSGGCSKIEIASV